MVDYQCFKVIGGNIINNKKERQSLTSLALYEVKNIPLLPISGVPTFLALAVRDFTPSNHSVQSGIRNVQFLLDFLGR